MSISNQYAKMSIKFILGNAYTQKSLKNDVLLAYVRNSILNKSFLDINQEWKLSLKNKQPERVHGDSKSKFGGAHCMSIGVERVPAAEGGGCYRVFGLYEGDEPLKDKLIIKAQFGDKITGNPESHVVTGLMLRTVCLLALKTAKFRGLKDIDESKLDVDPEAGDKQK